MLKLIRKISGIVDLFTRGIVSRRLVNGAAAGALAFSACFSSRCMKVRPSASSLVGMAGVYLCFALRGAFSIVSHNKMMTAAYEITAGVRLNW
ncbi:MAG: hypothetical protein ACLR7Z_16005 [Bilophila wadsworthia]